jgi:hypothetical protein
MKLRLTSVLGAMMLLTGCGFGSPPPFYASDASRRLQSGMSEVDVATALGQLPDSTGMTTCGILMLRPFPCKTLIYADSRYGRGLYGLPQTLYVEM